jgi:phytoene dehydrogenase-like protein
MGEDRRYVVIGGGLVGLASAVWLVEAGKDVTLVERRGQLGGRTRAMRGPTRSTTFRTTESTSSPADTSTSSGT